MSLTAIEGPFGVLIKGVFSMRTTLMATGLDGDQLWRLRPLDVLICFWRH